MAKRVACWRHLDLARVRCVPRGVFDAGFTTDPYALKAAEPGALLTGLVELARGKSRSGGYVPALD